MELEPVQGSAVVSELPEGPGPSGGIYDVPLVGTPARAVREFFDEMAPQPGDSTGVVVGKEMLRWGTVVAGGVAGTAVGLIVAL